MGNIKLVKAERQKEVAQLTFNEWKRGLVGYTFMTTGTKNGTDQLHLRDIQD